MGLFNTLALIIATLKILQLTNLSWWYVVTFIMIEAILTTSLAIFKIYKKRILSAMLQQGE